MNIIYMGTPEFAVKPLQAIVDAGHKVLACFTQPDKPKGRGKTLQPTPVKEKALSLDIPVYQPVKLREENVQIIRDYQPDAIVVAAYGQILPESILNIPQYGCINIHASLLPKYRGAAPIEWTIINGETESGVTTMYMAKGLDTGDMIEKTVVPIADTDTGVTLHDKLADAGAELILSTLSKLEDHTAIRTPQDDSLSCYASMLKKEMGELDFTKSARQIECLIRGLNPWPSAFTHLNGKMLKIWDADVVNDSDDIINNNNVSKECEAGTVCYVDKKTFIIKCGKDYLKVNELQLEGKKRMSTDAFLLGSHVEEGTA